MREHQISAPHHSASGEVCCHFICSPISGEKGMNCNVFSRWYFCSLTHSILKIKYSRISHFETNLSHTNNNFQGLLLLFMSMPFLCPHLTSFLWQSWCLYTTCLKLYLSYYPTEHLFFLRYSDLPMIVCLLVYCTCIVMQYVPSAHPFV